MIDAGFTSIFVGIETPTPEALVRTKKKQNVSKEDPEYPLHAVQTLQHKGFEVMAGFILGLDGETPEVFDLHIRFIQQSAIAMAMEGVLKVLKGTDLYHRLHQAGRLRGDTSGDNLDTHLNFVPEMPEEVLIAGYKHVLNTIYDRRLKNYFARCWTLLQRLDRRGAPTPMQTPLGMRELIHFVWASMKQLLSAQGPAYVQFLQRVITQSPERLRDACALAAKGYHLRQITEQVIAVDNFKSSLRREINHLQEDIARRAKDGEKSLRAYLRALVAQVQAEYGAIHIDFRHNVEDALQTFGHTLEAALRECQLYDKFSGLILPQILSVLPTVGANLEPPSPLRGPEGHRLR
jgi:hypothetical protein